MFEKLISTLMASRDQAHIFHWQTTGAGSFAAHTALNAYYDAIPDLTDALVESYQGKHGIITGYTAPEEFTEYEKTIVVKYFKGLGSHKKAEVPHMFKNFDKIIYNMLWGNQ